MPQLGGVPMRKQERREVSYRIRNIIEVFVFLIVLTWFWYGPRAELQKRSVLARQSYAYISGVSIEDQGSILLDQNHDTGEYQFTIKNNTQDNKEVLVSLRLDHEKIGKDQCEVIAYNKVGYYLSQVGTTDLTERSLSINGDILVTTLQPQEEKHYSLKYFISNDTSLTKNHFHAKAMLSSGQNL